MIRRCLFFLAIGTTLITLAAAAWALSAPVDDWKIAGPFGGTATTVAIDPENPQVVLAGALNSLLFASHDAGANWSLVPFPKRNLSEVTSLLVDPSDSKHYFAGVISAGGGGLYESRDAGETWSTVKDINNIGIRALTAAASQPSRFVAGTLNGVMLSDDSGKTWKRISDPQNLEMQGITAVAFDAKDPNIIYAGTTHLPWKTTDGGKTWESIHTGMIDDSDVFSIYVNPSDPTEILASACSGIYASPNRGDMWKKLMGIPNTSRRTHVVREDPTTASTIYAGTTTGLFKSLNHGTTWKTLTSTQVNALAFDPAKPATVYLALEYDGLGKSYDGGEAINPINTGFVDRVINAVTQSGNRYLALETQNGETTGIFASTDRGESWSQIRNMRGLAGVHLKAITGIPGDEKTLLAASPHQMYKSLDGGMLWKPIAMRLIVSPPPVAEKPKTAPAPVRTTRGKAPVRRARVTRPVKPVVKLRDITPSEISGLYAVANGAKSFIFAATDLGLLRSEDAGERWTLAELPGSTAVTALYLAPDTSGSLVARAAAGLFLSKDFGEHWTSLPFPLPIADVNDIALPAGSRAPLLAATRVGLYASSDMGQTWKANPGKFPASTVNSVVYGPEQTAYAVEYGQLFQTTDAGESWKSVPTALPSLWIRQLWMPDKSSHRLYGITSDLGILFRD